MKTKAEIISDMILREINKWDGTTNHEELMNVAKMFVPRLAKRIIQKIEKEK